MKLHPDKFLWGRNSPEEALEDIVLFKTSHTGSTGSGSGSTSTDGTERYHGQGCLLFGREKELKILMDAKDSIASHVLGNNTNVSTESNAISPNLAYYGSNQTKSGIYHQLHSNLQLQMQTFKQQPPKSPQHSQLHEHQHQPQYDQRYQPHHEQQPQHQQYQQHQPQQQQPPSFSTSSTPYSKSSNTFHQEINFKCQAYFLEGYAGCGKSSLMEALIKACLFGEQGGRQRQEEWFVLQFKFKKGSSAIEVIAKALNHFLGRHQQQQQQWSSTKNGNEGWGNTATENDTTTMQQRAFQRVCTAISSTIDSQGLMELSELIPNLRGIGSNIFGIAGGKGGGGGEFGNYDIDGGYNCNGTTSSNGSNGNDRDTRSSTTSTIDTHQAAVGSAFIRRMHLFHVLFKSICSAGLPVLFAYDDMQWATTPEGLENSNSGSSSGSASGGVLEGWKKFVMDYANIPCCTIHNNYNNNGINGNGISSPNNNNHGVLMVGTYRTNEVKEGDGLIQTIRGLEDFAIECDNKRTSNEGNGGGDNNLGNSITSIGSNNSSFQLTKLPIHELTKQDITHLLSANLCLPWRYTAELSDLVLLKTRGNPFFIVQFLESIVRNGMLSYSLRSSSAHYGIDDVNGINSNSINNNNVVCRRGWKWDRDVIDMQMISEGVAELLLETRFRKLPDAVMRTLRIVSCLGSRPVDGKVVDALSASEQQRNGSDASSLDMRSVLNMAVEEGILDKAGPLYQFTHDILQQTIYEDISAQNVKLLHKAIGESLLKSTESNNDPSAVDQINIYCKDDDNVGNGATRPTMTRTKISSEEHSHFARINATAAKYSIAASSFEQAKMYIDAGIKMLQDDRWENSYPLTLELYEMSANVSCINGDVAAMSRTLTEITSNVKSYEDSLNASSLLAKLLASSFKYGEAMENCLSVLSVLLGKEFLPAVDATNRDMVLSELGAMHAMLENITVEQVKRLPKMEDGTLKHAMNFLSMLITFSIIAKPDFVPILSCRMIRLTIENGFCDDSIVGLVSAGYGLFSFTDEIELGYRIGRVGEMLINESKNRHALRARLCFQLEGTLKCMVEPVQAAIDLFPDLYNSAMLSGLTEIALHCRRLYCNGIFYTGKGLLTTCTKHLVKCIQQSAKYQQNANMYATMSTFLACIFLTGERDFDFDILSFEELENIGEITNNALLQWQVFLDRMSQYFYMGDYVAVCKLSEMRPHTQHKRITEVVRTYMEGISSLKLARHTHQEKFKVMGEKAVGQMSKWSSLASNWNFQNQAELLQAELHYTNGDLVAAENAYKSSIVTARERKFIHEEATALELFGVYLVENGAVDGGMEQLKTAITKYKEWGADLKVRDLVSFLELINGANNPWNPVTENAQSLWHSNIATICNTT